MRTTTWLIDWASCWTAPGDMPEGGAVELPEDIPLPAISAIRTASPADSRRYRMALPLFAWAGMGPIIAPRPPMSRRRRVDELHLGDCDLPPRLSRGLWKKL